MEITVAPIGRVVSEGGRYFIELGEKTIDAALGLSEYGHVQVIWWAHLLDTGECRDLSVLDKPYKNGPEKVGVLATRSPVRPNPIMVTACALINVDTANRRLELGWIDAEDGTPVLDIKPYQPSVDRVRDVRIPAWCAHWPAWLEESGEFDWSAEFNFPD